MIPPEIYDYAIIFFTAFGGASLLLGLAGFAAAGITAILEAIDDIKRRLAARRFFRKFKADKIRLEIDEAKQQEELRRI